MIPLNQHRQSLLTPEAMYNTSEITMWKNSELHYLGASRRMIKLFGFNDFDDVVGKSVYEIKCKAVECADQFMYQDKLVLSKGISMDILDIHAFHGNITKLLLGHRSPLYDEQNQIIGTVYRGIKIEKELIEKLFCLLIASEKYYKNNKQNSYSNTMEKIDHTITSREKECLFYIVHGFTAKHIANKMAISPRTVETFMVSLKNKMHCHSKNQLIEAAINAGYLTYIPDTVFKKELSIILNTK